MRNIIDESAHIGHRPRFEAPVNIAAQVAIGSDVTIGRYSYLRDLTAVGKGCEIGRFCSIARGCEIGALEHPTDYLSTHPFQFDARHFRRTKGYKDLQRVAFPDPPATRIGHDVWIGAKAVIMRGVTIGHGAIVAAGAIVTKDVAPYTIVTGVPAKPLRRRFTQDVIDRLLAVAWWDRDMADLDGLPFDDIETCLKILEQTA